MINPFVQLAVLEGGGRIETVGRTFGVDLPHLISQIVSFCVVCAVLYRLAYRPILRILEARRQQIALGLANAEKIQAELERTEAQRQEVIQKANVEAIRIINEAHAAAARVQERETQKALAQGQEILVKSRETAAQDYALMLADLKRQVGRLVVRTTAVVTGKVLTDEDQRRLAEETARQLTT
jgi:F-type H+-transporting ATPase subunit b